MKNIYFIKDRLTRYLLLVVIFTYTSQYTDAQEVDFKIQGQLIDINSNESLPYAHIYNTRTKIGSVTDNDGYFGFENNKIGDTLSVSFIGYLPKKIVLNSDKPIKVELQENIQQLTEITLEYDNSDYLYKLINSCTKNKSKVKAEGKAYYELHTTLDNKQVELVESFYNARIDGYDLDQLKLKVGRLGVQINKLGGVSLSLESSVAIVKSRLIDDAEYFYKNPFQLSYKRLKKWYDLYKVKSYSEGNETIFVVRFRPKTSDLNLFNGLVWINKNTNQIHKITLECEDCKQHPFTVITDGHRKIDRVDLNIVKTFEKHGEGMILNHINFTYNLDYSRKEYKLKLKTNVLVHMYNFNDQFYIPKYNSNNERRHDQDYREIGEAPLNTFFWDNHNEFAVFDKANENETFFNHPNTIQGEEFLHNLNIPGYNMGEFFEHPSFTWSRKRLRFAEARQEDTTSVEYQQKKDNTYTGAFNGQFKADMYKFYGKIYLDRNAYNGKVDVITEAIFDSSRSFYKLPISWKVQVFVNMYFDLVEIERRKLERQIEDSDKSISSIEKLYLDSEMRLANTHKLYLKEVQRGENMPAMGKWNAIILSNLKINNLEVFLHDKR